jgi:hypothetical protein
MRGPWGEGVPVSGFPFFDFHTGQGSQSRVPRPGRGGESSGKRWRSRVTNLSPRSVDAEGGPTHWGDNRENLIWRGDNGSRKKPEEAAGPANL